MMQENEDRVYTLPVAEPGLRPDPPAPPLIRAEQGTLRAKNLFITNAVRKYARTFDSTRRLGWGGVESGDERVSVLG